MKVLENIIHFLQVAILCGFLSFWSMDVKRNAKNLTKGWQIGLVVIAAYIMMGSAILIGVLWW